jgi:predicted amidophosphoribosyltransferase
MAGLPDDIAPDNRLPGVDLFGQELVRECPHCGTGVQLDVDLCPICGSKLGNPDGGLVGLFDGMEFRDEDREIDCPLCGEHIVVEDGTCPACNEPVVADQRGDASEVEPLVHGHDILLMRLDVESGEVSYLQRAKDGEGWDQVTVHVASEDGRGRGRR